MEIEDKVYLIPGLVVTLKLDIPNRPLMIVIKKETSLFKNNIEDKKSVLKGIRCRWFTNSGELLEAVWSTKDLVLVQDN